MFGLLKVFAITAGLIKGLADSLSWGTFVIEDCVFQNGDPALSFKDVQRVRLARCGFYQTGVAIQAHDLWTECQG